MSMKDLNYIIGNRTRDLPACSAVPQPTALRRAPVLKSHHILITLRVLDAWFSSVVLIPNVAFDDTQCSAFGDQTVLIHVMLVSVKM